MNPNTCPECESYNTVKQATQPAGNDQIMRVMTCEDCPTQFSVIYRAFEKNTDFTEDSE